MASSRLSDPPAVESGVENAVVAGVSMRSAAPESATLVSSRIELMKRQSASNSDPSAGSDSLTSEAETTRGRHSLSQPSAEAESGESIECRAPALISEEERSIRTDCGRADDDRDLVVYSFAGLSSSVFKWGIASCTAFR